MRTLSHNSPTALAYARSLLELANEQKQTEVIAQELRELSRLVAENKTFGLFLADPGVSEAERAQMLKRVLGGRVSPLLMSFLGVLNEKSRLGILAEIADAFDDLLDEQLGKVEVDVTVSQRLSPEQLENVRQKVSAALKKDAVVYQYVDESIIGGLVLRVQDKLIDASVRYQLEAMKRQMLASAVQ